MIRFLLFNFVMFATVCAVCAVCQTEAKADIVPVLTPSLKRIFAGDVPKSVGDLKAMERHIQQLSQELIRATVSIRIDTSHGSGVIVGNDGYVLTAAHVIGQAGRPVQFTLADGRILSGITLGVHMPLDAGVAKVTDGSSYSGLKIGNSDRLRKGQWVLAAGHPGGLDIARGAVVRLGRISELGALTRTDCQLNAGDSGGPMINMRGQVMGINSRIGTSLANNLHTPSNSFKDRWDEFIAGQEWRGPAYLGVSGNSSAGKPLVTKVKENSPADDAGVRVGDVITHFAGHDVYTFRDLVYMVQSRHPGEDVTMKIERAGKKLEIDIVVGRKD